MSFEWCVFMCKENSVFQCMLIPLPCVYNGFTIPLSKSKQQFQFFFFNTSLNNLQINAGTYIKLNK